MEATTAAPTAPALATSKDTPDTLPEALLLFSQHWSPRLLTAAAVGFSAWRISLGGFGAADVLVACLVVAFWPLQEWLIHVFILHFKPKQLFGLRLDPMNARKHRAHHRDPWRVPLVFVPLPTVVTGIPGIAALAIWLLPTPLAATYLATYFVFSSHYEWVHYLCHIRYRPRSAHYRALVDSHRLHHFKNETRWLGVSLLMGDRLLGTAAEARDVARSPTVRTLGVTEPG